MNYNAIGEFTAFSRLAKDAADRRFALLHNLGGNLTRLSKSEHAIDFADVHAQLETIRLTEAELHAALERANSAAALAQEAPLSLYALCNK